jgi:UDPglucose 6-dehydrogenase
MVTVFGLGFVGLTTALGFAEMGRKVYGFDVDRDRLSTIASGKLPFMEPGLDRALADHLNKNFVIAEDPGSAISDSEVIYYCVGTPYGENGEANLNYLFAAIDQTLSLIKDNKFRVLVVKSTVPPSTASSKIIPYLVASGAGVGERIGVANNPEFLREGHCWDDFINADRVVIGTADQKSEKILLELYKNMKCPIFSVSLNTAEFVKYLSNTLLATLISFSNEMSIIADAIGGIDIAESFKIIHQDKRWNGCNMASYLYPGCGYGGYCLPKDTKAMYAKANSFGCEAGILKHVIETNDAMPDVIAGKIERAANFNKKTTIGILGLSFKPGSDDVRDCVNARIIAILNDRGYNQIVAYDPAANHLFLARYRDLKLICCDTRDELIERSDIAAILTAWDEFRGLNEITDKPIIDCRFML